MIYSMGEILIDFIQENHAYVPYAGGAPANVAIHTKRLGADACFVGKLSTDSFGSFLEASLRREDVYLESLQKSEKATPLAFVSHGENGERSFQFYRTDTADLWLSSEDVESLNVDEDTVVHFCSLGLVEDGSTRHAHLRMIQRVHDAGGIVSFDVNIRERLWDDISTCIDTIHDFLPYADIVKINEEELTLLTGDVDPLNALLNLRKHPHQVIVCTLGEKGALLLKPGQDVKHFPGNEVEAIDTTGAGDSFIATLLADCTLSNQDFASWIQNDLEGSVLHAIAISSKVVQHLGAIPQDH